MITDIDLRSAHDWVDESLSNGAQLAARVRMHLARLTASYLLLPSGTLDEPIQLDDQGRCLPMELSDSVAGPFLNSLRRRGDAVLIVEDDLALRRDPRGAGNRCCIGDRVIGWAAIDSDCTAAAALLRTGASGYPLNAFVVQSSAAKLGLAEGHDLKAEDVEVIARLTIAVIVSVFDAESFVAIALGLDDEALLV